MSRRVKETFPSGWATARRLRRQQGASTRRLVSFSEGLVEGVPHTQAGADIVGSCSGSNAGGIGKLVAGVCVVDDTRVEPVQIRLPGECVAVAQSNLPDPQPVRAAGPTARQSAPAILGPAVQSPQRARPYLLHQRERISVSSVAFEIRVSGETVGLVVLQPFINHSQLSVPGGIAPDEFVTGIPG